VTRVFLWVSAGPLGQLGASKKASWKNMEFNHNKGRKEVYSRRKCCNGKVRGQRKHGTPGRWSKALKAAGRVRGGSEER
jgi:hypothetical protein